MPRLGFTDPRGGESLRSSQPSRLAERPANPRPRSRAGPTRRADRLGRADRRGARAAADRPRRPPLPPRREPGRLLLLDPADRRRLHVRPAAPRPAAVLPDRGDVHPVRGVGLHRAAGPGADGHLDGGADVRPAASSAASPPTPPPSCWRSGRRICTSRASPARTSTSPRSRSRCSSWSSATSTRRAAVTRPVRRAAGGELRDQGVDLHHDLRGGQLLPRGDPRAGPPARRPARGADRAPAARRGLGAARVGRRGVPRPSTRCCSPRSSRTPAGSTACGPASTTGSASTASAAAASRACSTPSCCSPTSGR